MSIRISNIQRFSLHDGDGIRTTVFLKGCSLACPWCANPESKKFDFAIMYRKEKCLKRNKNCILNPKCYFINFKGKKSYKKPALCSAIDIVGSDYSSDKLLKELTKDIIFFTNGGGITFSGGEPLLQIDKMINLLRELKKEGISLTLETSLFSSIRNVRIAIKYFDSFFIDVKILDKKKAYSILGLNVDQYIRNLKELFSKVSSKNITIRFPIVPGFTDDKRNLVLIKQLLSEIKAKKIEIFSVHNFAQDKYISLGLRYRKYREASSSELRTIAKFLSSPNLKVEIISI